MLLRKLFILAFALCSFNSFGNGITVSNVTFNETTVQLSFTIEWENSWSYFSADPNLYDAAWIFIKYAPNGGDNWYHAEILDSIPVSGYFQYISYDDLGMMVYKNGSGNQTFGPQEFTVQLAPMIGSYQDFKVFATETVFVDKDDFQVGDGVSAGRFYNDGNINKPWLITSEDAISRGNGSGQFNQVGSSATEDLSANFPKGYNSIFCMKYKITAQQYVDFLNCLTRTQQQSRTNADLSGLTASQKYVMTNTAAVQDRNPIACDVNIGTGPIEFYLDLNSSNPPNSSDDGANLVLNHITPNDILAYFDWAGLRPMTELEYEKICRGQGVPAVAGEYAWGTATYNPSGSITNDGENNESTSNVGVLTSLFSSTPLRSGYSATSTSSRTASGGTFWGIMDIHTLGEFMYGVESTSFSKESYGNGDLNSEGNAVVAGWTNNAKLLSTLDPTTPNIQAISEGKSEITFTTRSAYLGARGVRKLIEE